MQTTRYVILTVILFTTAFSVNAEKKFGKARMSATGTFEVALEPQDDGNTPAGRMIIRKEYKGDLTGSGTGQMLSKRLASGVAVYSAIEEFSGSIAGKKGSFTLVHNGFMSADKQKLEVYVLQGSGTDELANISGTLDIITENNKHQYVFHYAL